MSTETPRTSVFVPVADVCWMLASGWTLDTDKARRPTGRWMFPYLVSHASLDGYIAGLTAYAWWKDGVQYVGTCGTTLKEAIERAKKEYGQ